MGSKSNEKLSNSNSKAKAKRFDKQQKQLLETKIERQRLRNIKMMRLCRQLQDPDQLDKKKAKSTSQEQSTTVKDCSNHGSWLADCYRDGCFRRLLMCLRNFLARVFHFFTVTLCSIQAFHWYVFLVNNLGLYQEYEINDYGQRLSPRTGRPVLLSLGPLRVVQIVESANEMRSHWDPYIKDYLKNSHLSTDCWRANRMAMQVALCMDDAGTMHDMPLEFGTEEAGGNDNYA